MHEEKKVGTTMNGKERQTKMFLKTKIDWIVTVFLISIGFLYACDDLGPDFLEQPPSIDVDKDVIFSRSDYAERFLTNAYQTLPFGPGGVDATPYRRQGIASGGLLASLTDINYASAELFGANGAYYQQTTVPYGGGSSKYSYNNSGAWAGIRSAHIFIENIDRVPDMDATTKARRKGEARMIIALHYTQMFRHFGGLPWVNRAFTPNEDFNLPRLTARATLDSTVAVINRAIPDLPFTLDNSAVESGRFTQASAMGLKCRLLLFGASPLFNASEPYIQHEAASQELIWYGGEDQGLWQRAADACKELIDRVEETGVYHLVDTGNPREDFRTAYLSRESPEVLISTRLRYRVNNEYGFISTNSGRITTTHNYVQMFPMADGTPIDVPGSGYDPQNPYENRDPRLYETVLVNGDSYAGRTAELWIGGQDRTSVNDLSTATGYRMRKFSTPGGREGDHFPYLRLPEIYLSYAEALNEINGGPTQETYEYVNRVRNRVNLDDLPSGLSQEEFREAVIRERVLEFGYEEVRWFDMVRWKREDDFTKSLYGLNIIGNEDDSFNYEEFELTRKHWQDNWSPKWYLSAFPRSEELKGLIQNPR